MEQYKIRKIIYFDSNAKKEFYRLPFHIRVEFDKLISELTEEGKLKVPDGKKLTGTKLFEMRVRSFGAWRGIYAYVQNNEIILLSFFNKKRQKTTKNQINKVLKRLKYYV